MKNIALRFIVLTMSLHFSSPAFAQNKVVVGYFSTDSAEHFEKEVRPLFEEFKGKCAECEIVNLTPYDAKGAYAEKDLVGKFKNDADEVAFYFFDWNRPATNENRALIDILTEKIESGKPVLAATGHAAPGEAAAPLSKTVFGQLKDVVIIGEVTGRERMLPQSYFGPEMLTALKTPKEYEGRGVSPLYFAGRWASVWSKKKPAEWLAHFKNKKQKNRKIFLDINDLLVR